jgi:hypothetical protein
VYPAFDGTKVEEVLNVLLPTALAALGVVQLVTVAVEVSITLPVLVYV